MACLNFIYKASWIFNFLISLFVWRIFVLTKIFDRFFLYVLKFFNILQFRVLTLELILNIYIYIYIYIYIIIIIMSYRQHRYPWLSLATFPYRSSPLAVLQGYNPCSHKAAVCMFELVVLLLNGHMWGSIGGHHLWARPSFSSSVLQVWFV